MRKSIIISLIALLISITGLLVALIAYFKRRSCALCDDLLECYDEDDCCDCCGDDCEAGDEETPECEAEDDVPGPAEETEE